MEPEDWLRSLASETARFAALLGGDLSRPVPACPGWDLAALGRHLGGVHRWAASACTAVTGPGAEPSGPDEPAAVPHWYAASAALLLDELRTRAPDQPCWTLAGTRTVVFWARRQAHETAVHRWDAERALGLAASVDPALARDGVAEVVEVVLPRQLSLGRLSADVGSVLLELGPGGAGDRVPVGPGRVPVATVRADPEVALLLLWRRVPADDPRIVITGDRDAALRLLASPLTP